MGNDTRHIKVIPIGIKVIPSADKNDAGERRVRGKVVKNLLQVLDDTTALTDALSGYKFLFGYVSDYAGANQCSAMRFLKLAPVVTTSLSTEVADALAQLNVLSGQLLVLLISLSHGAFMLVFKAGHWGGQVLDHLDQAGHVPGEGSDLGGYLSTCKAHPTARVILLPFGYAVSMHPCGTMQAPHNLFATMMTSVKTAAST